CRSAGRASRYGAEGEDQGQIELAHGRPAGVAVAHAEPARGAAAGARRAYRRGAQGVRLQCEGNRGAAPEQRDLTGEIERRAGTSSAPNPEQSCWWSLDSEVRTEPAASADERRNRTTSRGGQTMDDVTKTDKMLARKEGHVGYVIFNNPERHNAVSLDMWAATSAFLDEFAKDD